MYKIEIRKWVIEIEQNKIMIQKSSWLVSCLLTTTTSEIGIEPSNILYSNLQKPRSPEQSKASEQRKQSKLDIVKLPKGNQDGRDKWLHIVGN